MKLKSKLTALFLATALIGGSLIGCGKNTPSAPAKILYYVNITNDSTKTTVSDGVQQNVGYEAGTILSFTVSVVNTAYELVDNSVLLDNTPLTATDGTYSFTMPAKNVELEITPHKKDVWNVAFKPALKVTFTSQVEVFLNDQKQVASSYTLESSDPTKAEVVDSEHILGKAATADDEKVTISVKKGTTTVYTTDEAVLPLQKGDTQENPMTAKEALAYGLIDTVIPCKNKAKEEEV